MTLRGRDLLILSFDWSKVWTSARNTGFSLAEGGGVVYCLLSTDFFHCTSPYLYKFLEICNSLVQNLLGSF